MIFPSVLVTRSGYFSLSFHWTCLKTSSGSDFFLFFGDQKWLFFIVFSLDVFKNFFWKWFFPLFWWPEVVIFQCFSPEVFLKPFLEVIFSSFLVTTSGYFSLFFIGGVLKTFSVSNFFLFFSDKKWFFPIFLTRSDNFFIFFSLEVIF